MGSQPASASRRPCRRPPNDEREIPPPASLGFALDPDYDNNGLIYGMQFSTKHLHLGFDILDKQIMINHLERTISDHPFLHLGQCIHVDIIKEFLKEKNVKFFEGS